MKKPNPKIKLPKDWRVAMVVTKSPSEPWAVVKKTLKAMTRQKYPHTTWLADENPSEKVKKWCNENRVKISTRKGVAGYHQNQWPKRTKCKEGNLAYFYDKSGYNSFDFVVQLDADHVPGNLYLKAMLAPFIDPKVGYVSAPSICDANAKKSWVARGRLYVEATLHGALQAGYNDGWAPLCIGSHYAVRTKALRDIGGLGPELAEDHSTTLFMQAGGWKGVHAVDATAHGDGPETFTDCMTQEYQWSRSLTIILLKYMPKLIFKLPPKIAFQFLFAQTWYSIFGFSLLVAYLLPIVALYTDTPWVHVNYFVFMFYSLLLTTTSFFIVFLIKKFAMLRPTDAKIIAWESIFFQFVRWPWVVWGVLSAIFGVLFNMNFNFKVTPKGNGVENVLTFKLILPYILIIVVSSLSAVLITTADNAKGYYYFVLVNSVTYLATLIIVLVKHAKEAKNILG